MAAVCQIMSVCVIAIRTLPNWPSFSLTFPPPVLLTTAATVQPRERCTCGHRTVDCQTIIAADRDRRTSTVGQLTVRSLLGAEGVNAG